MGVVTPLIVLANRAFDSLYSTRWLHGIPPPGWLQDATRQARSGPLGDANVQFFKLLITDGCRGVGHEVDGLGGFGEGDDFAQAGRSRKQHHDAIEAERDSAVRRGAVLEGIE